jgi:hypothetical protein
MTTQEVTIFEARLALFTNLGLDIATSEALSDRLLKRDRDADERHTCMECSYIQSGWGWSCGNWRVAGIAVCAQDTRLPRDFAIQPQHCNGFRGQRLTSV